MYVTQSIMDSLLNSITIDPAERRKTQNRLAKRKSRIHAGNISIHAYRKLIKIHQDANSHLGKQQGAMEAANALVGRQPTSVFTSTQQTIKVRPTVLGGILTAYRSASIQETCYFLTSLHMCFYRVLHL